MILQTLRGVAIAAIWQRAQISQVYYVAKLCPCFTRANNNGIAIFVG